MPGTLQELQHENAHPLANGAQSGSHGSRGLALARAGIHHDESTTDVRHSFEFRVSGFKFLVSIRARNSQLETASGLYLVYVQGTAHEKG